jgi:hypothetical protein
VATRPGSGHRRLTCKYRCPGGSDTAEIAQAQRAFEDAVEAFDTLLEQLSRQSVRNRMRADIADRICLDAKGVLNDIPLYKGCRQTSSASCAVS